MTEKVSYGSSIFLMWIGAYFPFFVGTLFSPIIGRYGQELAYQVGCFFVAFAVLGTVLVYFMENGDKEIKEGKELVKITPTIVVLSLLMFAILFGCVAFVSDRYNNPTERFCHEDIQSRVDKIVVLHQGMCIENETGFHANGKAMFP